MAGGYLFIKKPPGMTSHDVVDAVRKITGERRVGHAGTLDPFAEGLLIVGLGREATRRLSQFMKQPKVYRAVMRLGAVSSTGDPEGRIIAVKSAEPSHQTVFETLKKFTGEIRQIPPIFSAIKIRGKKAYELARAGKKPDLEPRQVRIFRLKLIRYKYPELEFEARVSSGTYIRSLAQDIGHALGCGGYLIKLERTAIGAIGLEQAAPLRRLTKENWSGYLQGLRLAPLKAGRQS